MTNEPDELVARARAAREGARRLAHRWDEMRMLVMHSQMTHLLVQHSPRLRTLLTDGEAHRE